MIKNNPINTNNNKYGNNTKNQDMLLYPPLHNLCNIKVQVTIYKSLNIKYIALLC